jgi:protein ImuB
MKSEKTLFAAVVAPGIAASSIPRRFSPSVESIDPNTVLLDVSGMHRLLGAPDAIARAISAQAGPRANVAIAANRHAALHAARGYPGIVIIPPGEEAARLGGLPVSLLDTTPEILSVLERWGIHTFRELAALPEAGLVERFGAEGARLKALAGGAAEVPLKAGVEPKLYQRSWQLDEPIELLEPLSFVLSRLLHQLCLDLQHDGAAAHALTLQFSLSGKTHFERTIRFPVPSRDPVHFLKLLQLDLQARPPAHAIETVTLWMEPAPPRAIQSGLFLPPAPAPERLELTLKRLAALVGEENVGSPRLVDTHRPGAFQIASFLDAPSPLSPWSTATLAIRVFRPPLAVDVFPAAGPPRRIASSTIRGQVLDCAGPWRTSGDWWTENPWARDDFDLALSDGALYRVYREAFSGRWFLHGRYD